MALGFAAQGTIWISQGSTMLVSPPQLGLISVRQASKS